MLKHGTKKLACCHAVLTTITTCKAGQVTRRSPPNITPSAFGPQTETGGSLSSAGPVAGGGPAGHSELAWPGACSAAQQLRDAFRKWLMAQTRDIEEVIDLVVLEHFISWLPRGFQCHRPTSLNQDIQLAENHLVACPGVGEPLPNISLSSPSSSLPPIPIPRSYSTVPPWPPPQRQGSLASELPDLESAGASTSYPPLPSLRQSLGYLSVAEKVVRILSTGSAPLTDSCSSLISCSSIPIFP